MSFRALYLAALGLFVAGAPAAMAADPAGWYASGMAGATWLGGADNFGEDSGLRVHSETDPGYNIVGAIGRSLGNGLRIEGEIGYRHADLSKLTVGNDGGLGAAAGVGSLNGLSGSPSSGNSHALSFMANGYYDIDLPGTPLKPYIGGGIGFARVSADNVRFGGASLVDDSDVVFAYQVGAGLTYPLTAQTSAFVDYRYFATEDPTFTDAVGGRIQSEFKTQNVSVGMRYRF